MWPLINMLRVQAKLALTILALDLLVLVVVLTGLSAIFQTLLHPAISIVGIVWVVATAAACWMAGGVETDSLILARLFGLEIGREFVNAVKAFFLIQVSIIGFFLIMPIWSSWPGYFTFLVLFAGFILSGRLAHRLFTWNYFYWPFRVFLCLILALIIISAFGYGVDWWQAFLASPANQTLTRRILFLGIVLSFLGIIPKMKPVMIIGLVIAGASGLMWYLPEIKDIKLPAPSVSAEAEQPPQPKLMPPAEPQIAPPAAPAPRLLPPAGEEKIPDLSSWLPGYTAIPTGVTLRPGWRLPVFIALAVPPTKPIKWLARVNGRWAECNWKADAKWQPAQENKPAGISYHHDNFNPSRPEERNALKMYVGIPKEIEDGPHFKISVKRPIPIP